MTKIDREFCLSDDSVNVYGYRMLTGGCDLNKFKPAIGFLMHNREAGVAVRWEDLRTENGCIYGKPVINDKLFPDLAQQIEEGFYSAASVGGIVAIEVSDDLKYKLEGQTGVTVLKWFPRECSIVDVPGNYSAIAKLYDERDNILFDLTDQLLTEQNKIQKMEKIEIKDLGLPNLADNATVEQVKTTIADLVAKALRVDTAELALKELRDKVNIDNINAILENGLNAKKLTKELSEKLKADYANNPEGLKALVDAMPAQQSVVNELKGDGEIPAELKNKTFNDLYVSGELAEVKEKYPNHYNKLVEAIK